MSLRYDSINPPARRVAHAVAADAGVVTVADEDGAIRGDADVGGAKPGIGAGKQVDLVKLVSGTLRSDAKQSHLTRTGVSVQEVAGVSLGGRGSCRAVRGDLA